MLAVSICNTRPGLTALCALLLLPACHDRAVRTDTQQSADATRAAIGDAHRATSPHESDYWDWRLSYPTGEVQASWLKKDLQREQGRTEAVPSVSAAQQKAFSLGDGVLEPSRATSIGPQPLDWGNIDLNFGQVGGRVNVLLTHPSNPSVAWFGSDGGGVWKTSNCCGTETVWQPKTESAHLSNISIGALTMDPNNPDVIYAGTGDFRRNRPFTFSAGGLLKSADGGETWSVLGSEVFNPVYAQPVGDFPQFRAISFVLVDPLESGRLAVGTNQGLYFGRDGGTQWTGPCLTNEHTTQRQDVTGLLRRASPSGASELIVAIGALGRSSSVRPDLLKSGANGVYRGSWPTTAACPNDWQLISRSDNGWLANSGNGISAPAANPNPLKRIDLAVAPSDDRVLYAQVENMGVWRSQDGGTSWTRAALQPSGFSQGCMSESFENGMLFQSYNAGLIVSPTDPNVVFLSATDIWRSLNGGTSFTNLSCGYGRTSNGQRGIVHVDNHARAFVANDAQRLLIGNDGGVNFSANALATNPSFASLNGGASTIEFYSGDITANFNHVDAPLRAVGGGAQDNGGSNRIWGSNQSIDTGTWNLRQGGDGIQVQVEPVLGQRWYYSAQFGYIGASQTGPAGAANTVVTPAHDWNDDRRGFLMPYSLYKHGGEDTCPAAAGCQRMLVGTSRVWESITGGIPNTSWYINSPDLTKVLALNNDLSIINKVEHAPSDGTRAIAATNDGNVWMARNLGRGANTAIWTNVSESNRVLPNRPMMDAQIHPTDSMIALVGIAGFDQNTPATPGHIYRLRCESDCTTFEWRNVSGDLPNIPVNAVQFDPAQPRRVFAGTDWGLYFTEDIEAATPRWFRFGGGLPSVTIWDLVVDRGNTTLAIFTRSRGAWLWPLDAELAPPNLTGLWSTTGEGGWGVSIAHQGDLLFPVWYTYDQQGRPVWITSTPARQSDGSYLGDAYRFDGTPFNLIDGPAYQPGQNLGTVRYTRIDEDTLRYDSVVEGHSQTKILRRVNLGTHTQCRFTTEPRASALNHSDIWWTPSQPGWGVHLTEAGDLIFASWYTYAADGKAMWVTGLLQRQSGGHFIGPLNRPQSGTPYPLINGPATTFPVPEVGTARIDFIDGERASFQYTLDGISQQKSIARLEFSGPGRTVCE